MFFAKPIPLFKDVTPNDNTISDIKKRQVEQPTSVVHVTITAAGTVVYTHTATSYSFIPSYSTIAPTASSIHNGTHPGNSDSNPSSSSSPNLGAIIGGAVGGVAFIALIGLAFLFMRRSKKKKTILQPPGGYIDDTDSYYQRGGADMTSSVPAPRHLVAPLPNGGSESKYFQQHDGGYYDDMVSSPHGNYATNPTYYSTTNSITSDSSPPTTVDGHTSFRHISNLNPERHVPHLKDRIEEPPHSRD